MGGPGSGGHNRRSVEEHLRNGTYRPSRHGRISFFTVDAMKTDLSPDAWLPREAKRLFDELSPELIASGRLTSVNLRLFEALCVVWAHLVSLDEQFEKHPQMAAYNAYMKQFLKLVRYFGLTPRARGKL